MSDGVSWLGEPRRGLGHQAGAGKRAALDVARRAAQGSVLVAGVASGAIGGRSRVGLRSADAGGESGGRNRRCSVRAGGGHPCGVGDDAGTPVLVEGACRDAEVPGAGAAAHPGSEQLGRLGGHLGVDDGTSTTAARREEGVFAVLSVAFDDASDGGAGEGEGGHDVGLGDTGNDVQLGGAEQRGAAVGGGMAIEGLEIEEVVGDAIAGLHGVTVADGSGVGEGEGEREDHRGAPYMYRYILSDKRKECQVGNHKKEQKVPKKRGCWRILEATGGPGERTMSGSLSLYEEDPDLEATRRIVSHVVAAEIEKWFRHDVLAPQDVLVDVPHLLMRMPFLLGAGTSNIDRWNNAIRETEPPYGLDESVFERILVDSVFTEQVWLQTPCFWWPLLKSCEKLNEMFYGDSNEEWEDAVFCEDVSIFRRASDTDGTAPVEFVTELEGAWARRYVARIEVKNYVPGSRFAI